MTLPDVIDIAVKSIFDLLAPDRAMSALIVCSGPARDLAETVESALRDPALLGRPALAAGLWLYVDDLDRSHAISQQIEDATGAFWHGIMHRREGDFSNSHYWFNRVGKHPAMAAIPEYDPHVFIDTVAAEHRTAPQGLVELQRREWIALFAWCAAQTD